MMNCCPTSIHKNAHFKCCQHALSFPQVTCVSTLKNARASPAYKTTLEIPGKKATERAGAVVVELVLLDEHLELRGLVRAGRGPLRASDLRGRRRQETH